MQHHKDCFGVAPKMATADRGFFSAQNEREAEALGVHKVALPARGRLSKKRAKRQRERWFKRALRWRAGSEATISHLKNPFSMKRATYKGDPGFKRYVGWCVITKNLFSIARWLEHKKQRRVEHVEGG
jgi:transposase, IS5 family